MNRISVAVVGPGTEATPGDCTAAREVGRLLAEHDVVVLTGGLGGVMAAAAEGATAAGGSALGLLPGSDRSEGHAAGLVVPTGLGELRNALLVRAADGVIAIGGSWGTLSEIAFAERTGKPVIAIGGWLILTADGTPVPHQQASSPGEAVRRLLESLPS